MLQDFSTVASNVLTLFLLMGVGVLCAKTKLLSDGAVKALANLVLYIATPASSSNPASASLTLRCCGVSSRWWRWRRSTTAC